MIKLMSHDNKIVVPVKLFTVLKEDSKRPADVFTRLDAFISLTEAAESSKYNSIVAFNGERFSLSPGQVAISIQSLEKRWNWEEEKIKHFLQTLSSLEVLHYETHDTVIIFSFPFINSFVKDDSENYFPESYPCGYEDSF